MAYKTGGYSGTPLYKKLGIKRGYRIVVACNPVAYHKMVDLPEDVTEVTKPDDASIDFIHLFAKNQAELTDQYARLKPYLKKTGLMWVSWPKKASKMPTDINRESVRSYILDRGLVDVKVASVNETWSALKFVYRIKDR